MTIPIGPSSYNNKHHFAMQAPALATLIPPSKQTLPQASRALASAKNNARKILPHIPAPYQSASLVLAIPILLATQAAKGRSTQPTQASQPQRTLSSTNHHPFEQFEKMTVAKMPWWGQLLNQFMHWEDLVFAAIRAGSFVDHQKVGVLDGIYARSNVFGRTHTGKFDWAGTFRGLWTDPISIMGAMWDGYNAFFSTLNETKSPGKAFAAGLSEGGNMILTGYYFAEPIQYAVTDLVTKGIGKLFPKYAKTVETGWGRTLTGGLASLVVIEALIRLWTRFITPKVVEKAGPALDKFFKIAPETARQSSTPLQYERGFFPGNVRVRNAG